MNNKKSKRSVSYTTEKRAGLGDEEKSRLVCCRVLGSGRGGGVLVFSLGKGGGGFWVGVSRETSSM